MNRLRARRKLPFRRPALSSLRCEGGFLLVEVMVSAVLLVVLTLATYPILDQSAGRTSSNRARAVAVSLGELDQDRMRAMNQTALRGLDQTYTKTMNGVVFTIHSEADDVSDTTAAVTCSASSGAAQYEKTTSTITWPNMNGIDPVQIDSIVSPSLSGVNRGTLVVTVQKADGTGQPGIPLTAGGSSKTTDSTGCAFWTDLPSGATTVTANSPGYVDINGLQAVSLNATIAKGETSSKSFLYDSAAAVPTTFKDQTIASNLATKWFSATYAPSGTPQIRPATQTVLLSSLTAAQAGSLFPFTAGYQVYAGECPGSEPTQYTSNFYTTHPLAAVKPLAGTNTTSAIAYTRRITLTVTEGGTTKLAKRQPRYVVKPNTAVPAMAGCAETTFNQTGPNASTDPNATSFPNTLDLPFGSWSICADDNNGTSSRMGTVNINNFPDNATGQTNAAVPLTLATTNSQCPS